MDALDYGLLQIMGYYRGLTKWLENVKYQGFCQCIQLFHALFNTGNPSQTTQS
jgi:hypothetical protein